MKFWEFNTVATASNHLRARNIQSRTNQAKLHRTRLRINTFCYCNLDGIMNNYEQIAILYNLAVTGSCLLPWNNIIYHIQVTRRQKKFNHPAVFSVSVYVCVCVCERERESLLFFFFIILIKSSTVQPQLLSYDISV